jgi:hypothetical protein
MPSSGSSNYRIRSWFASLSRSILIRSGARRQAKVLDEVSTAILGGAAAENLPVSGGG